MTLRDPRPWLLLGLLAACGGGDAPSGAGEAGAGATRPDVVLVIVDTLRKDHLSAYGYGRPTTPRLEELAADGVRFDRALAAAPWTTPSIGALLTSRWPTAIGLHGTRSVLADELVLLPEVLREAGYHTAGVISHSFLGGEWNFDQGYAAFDESNVRGHHAVTSAGVTDRALEQVDARPDDGSPLFLLVHYFDPHATYVDQPGAGFAPAPGYAGPIRGGMRFRSLEKLADELTEPDLDELRRIYDTEVHHTDRELGRLLDGLRARGVYDDALVVLTADHGEAFLDHGHLGHTFSLYDELVNVPLIVKYPAAHGDRGRVVDTPVSLVDVLPTVLRLADLAPPAGIEGVPLEPGEEPPAGRLLFTETGRSRGVRAVVRDGTKLVHWVGQERWERFDLATDPGERANLVEGGAAPDDELARALEAWAARVAEQAVVGGDKDLTDAQRAHLDALGYGGDEDDPDVDDAEGSDGD